MHSGHIWRRCVDITVSIHNKAIPNILICVCNLFTLSTPQTTKLREQSLKEAVALQQFQTDANDMEVWIMETLRQVSSQEVGHDEFSTTTIARKQREIEEEIQSHRPGIDSMHEQVQAMPEAYLTIPQVCVLCCSYFLSDDMLLVVLNYCLWLIVGGGSPSCY